MKLLHFAAAPALLTTSSFFADTAGEARATKYNVTFLQDVSGQANSGADAINASGQSVGSSSTVIGGYDRIGWDLVTLASAARMTPQRREDTRLKLKSLRAKSDSATTRQNLSAEIETLDWADDLDRQCAKAAPVKTETGFLPMNCDGSARRYVAA
jgi:hypothetical protein